jgi:23S rRNA (guanosine2251-2'-O)-methyltransferase
MDRLTSHGAHQGVAVQIPAYEYAHPDDLLTRAYDAGEVPLIVALDGVTDPRNLGAITRSAAAFGAHGVLVPERRTASMTASAWKTSAGAAARIPVARATNLNRALKSYKDAGLLIAGLDMGGEVELPDLQAATEPLVLVVGSEGKGLARLVRENCDIIVSIPMTSATESLNAGIATGVALYEISRRRS